jgi:hypothetical protein
LVSRTTTETLDDLDHETMADQVVVFGFGGRRYEIDLSDKHAEQFAAVMAYWIEAARDITTRPRSSARQRTTASRRRTAEIRRWAIDEGLVTLSSGRLPSNVIARWEREHLNQ